MGRSYFMLENNKHHKIDEGMFLHYPDTCNVLDIPSGSIWGKLSTDMGNLDPIPHPNVVGRRVEIKYETKGVLSFSAEISPNRAAWQRIAWKPNLRADTDWKNDRDVQRAIEHFLWVANCEEARKILPKEWWL